MSFNMNTNRYKYILKNVIFNEPKKEKEIFKMLVKGYNAIEIGDKIGMHERTIYRRKKDLAKKITEIL